MNTAIAQHLNVATEAIIEVQEWARVLWVRVRGLGARFVSKKVVKVMIVESQLPSGEWSPLTEDQLSRAINQVLDREHWYAPRVGRAPMTTAQEVLEHLGAGYSLSYGDDWYAEIRQQPQPVAQLSDDAFAAISGMHRTQSGGWMDDDEYMRLQEMGIDA